MAMHIFSLIYDLCLVTRATLLFIDKHFGEPMYFVLFSNSIYDNSKRFLTPSQNEIRMKML